MHWMHSLTIISHHHHLPGPFELLYMLVSPDGGPIYQETDFTRTIVEPMNALSAALFILIVLYFARKVYRDGWQKHKFLTYTVPLLAIGGIGGTIYHAFRVSQVFLVMDYMPIILLTLAASIYFWTRVTRRWWYSLFIIVPLMSLPPVLFWSIQNGHLNIPRNVAINMNYATLGVIVVTPLFIYLYQRNWKYWQLMAAALISFALAIFFRAMDKEGLLSFGTHWLWHVFGAVATALVFELVYRWRPQRNAPAKAT